MTDERSVHWSVGTTNVGTASTGQNWGSFLDRRAQCPLEVGTTNVGTASTGQNLGVFFDRRAQCPLERYVSQGHICVCPILILW